MKLKGGWENKMIDVLTTISLFVIGWPLILCMAMICPSLFRYDEEV